MSPAAEKAVADMLWQWVSTACRKDVLAPARDWQQWGTENIGAIMWSSLWGATQIVAEHPDYRDKRYAEARRGGNGASVQRLLQTFHA